MDSFYCSPSESEYICIGQTISWSFPLLYLIILLIARFRASKIHLFQNKNVNNSTIIQYLLILSLPLIEILILLLMETQTISISRFLSYVCVSFNAIICCGLMKLEFPRMISPGVYTIKLRLYFLTLFFVEMSYLIMIILFSIENSLIFSLILSQSLKLFALFTLNIMSFYSLFKAKNLHLQPLLYEDEQTHPISVDSFNKPNNDEDNDEYRMTRSQSIMNYIPRTSSDFNPRNDLPFESKSNKGKGISVDIQKVLISHDSNSEIIVLYEIKVFDMKGKAVRTIYRRFSEFETLHNEVRKNQFLI